MRRGTPPGRLRPLPRVQGLRLRSWAAFPVAPDSGRLQEELARPRSRIDTAIRDYRPALPLYTEADAARSLPQFSPTPFSKALDDSEALPWNRLVPDYLGTGTLG
jgi:hypothetical protein